MMQQMILKGPDFCAVVEDGRLVEYIRQDPKEQGGDILLGKIDRMMPNLNCAFVDIGRTKNGFLDATILVLPVGREREDVSGRKAEIR